MRLAVGIVGARRARQGLGPYVARDLIALGAELRGYTATSEATLSQAARQLEEYGIQSNGYTSVDRLIESENLDALAILSPADHHFAALEQALAARLHVLCEKPQLWGPGSAETAEGMVRQFESQSLLLFENCQWPRTLETYFSLFPDAAGRTPQCFSMSLCPASAGLQLLIDALPHPLSMLAALAPGPDSRIENLELEIHNAQRDHLGLRFEYVTSTARIRTQLEFLRRDQPGPRPASYALDGGWVERRIREPGYRMELTDGARAAELPDPLRAHLGLFLETAQAVRLGGALPDSAPLRARQRHLAAICEPCRAELAR